jgi:hypothetical protein
LLTSLKDILAASTDWGHRDLMEKLSMPLSTTTALTLMKMLCLLVLV